MKDETERLSSAIATLRNCADRLEAKPESIAYEIFVMRQNADLYEGRIGTIGARQNYLRARYQQGAQI